VSETQVGAELTIDHFQPLSHGGSNDPDNWVYACHACNEFKGNYWREETTRRILHPLRDTLSDHMLERSDGVLDALTETGAFHIERLNLNRASLVAHRREYRLIGAALHAQNQLQRRLERIEQELRLLTDLLRLGESEDDTSS
jgi:hypothetical protein